MKTRRLNKNGWILIITIILCLFSGLLLDIIHNTSIYKTPYGMYNCRGSVIKICTGSVENYNYEK